MLSDCPQGLSEVRGIDLAVCKGRGHRDQNMGGGGDACRVGSPLDVAQVVPIPPQIPYLLRGEIEGDDLVVRAEAPDETETVVANPNDRDDGRRSATPTAVVGGLATQYSVSQFGHFATATERQRAKDVGD